MVAETAILCHAPDLSNNINTVSHSSSEAFLMFDTFCNFKIETFFKWKSTMVFSFHEIDSRDGLNPSFSGFRINFEFKIIPIR